MAQKISRAVAAQMVREYSGSQFFSVSFVKRTTGELREMTCRKGVSKFVTGAGMAYEPSSKGLVGVWEANTTNDAKAYRMIPLEGLRAVKMNGNTFEVVGE